MTYRFLPIIHILAKLNILFSCLLWAPAWTAFYFHDRLLPLWLWYAFFMVSLSLIVWQKTKKYRRDLQARDGFLLVFLLWILFALSAALPIYFAGSTVTFTNAYFEAISGLTTTGSTIFPNLEALPPSINLWRHMLNWVGGMGIIVLAVAIIPTLGIGGMNMFKAEVSGINKNNKLTPRITQTAKTLWAVYIALTAVIIIALRAVGMNWFDAVCHAFSSISLGGFSTHSASVAYFNSVAVEWVLIISMLLGMMSFICHVLALRERSLKVYFDNEEVRAGAAVLIISIAVGSIYLYYCGYYGRDWAAFLTTLRVVTFNYVSIGTSCGFSSADFARWPVFVSILMYVLANFAPNSSSTGGGIKMIRIIILFKFMYREMNLLLHPYAVNTVKINDTAISPQVAANVMAFIFAYLMTLLISSLIFMFTGVDAVSSFTFMVGAITNSGPGIGVLGPTADLSQLSDFQKWLTAFTMLIGRLEIFTVFILFLPGYWRS